MRKNRTEKSAFAVCAPQTGTKKNKKNIRAELDKINYDLMRNVECLLPSEPQGPPPPTLRRPAHASRVGVRNVSFCPGARERELSQINYF